MKKLYFLIAALASYNCTTAQSLDPQVISSSGTTFNNGSSQIDFTTGEPATATLTGSGSGLTQGFHQPQLLVTAVDKNIDPNVSVFPNPSVSYLQVQFTDLKENTMLEIYSMEGKLLQSKAVSAVKEVQIDMSSYAPGNYLLSIKENNKPTITYKISKTN
ncbi:MAG TPA: T9SS type A sorting domain-containing protein [Bacteroidia bacterium]